MSRIVIVILIYHRYEPIDLIHTTSTYSALLKHKTTPNSSRHCSRESRGPQVVSPRTYCLAAD
jgi:hypothetical protein